ncbi:MAG: SHOCT domain-containing protein [Candidatus Moraniibacteriota bacterium]
MMWDYYGHMGAGYGLGFIFMLVFWVLVIWAIFALVRVFLGRGSSCCGTHHKEIGAKTSNAIDILKERYAKGEITKEDFDRMKKNIE